mmetsp:Transcript_145999/g.468164  ORF Transcript_145999/g.468164 Transcript_145999/m.468164 type:complete len:261 (+) Transcript_145999:173-955(+)
MEAEVRLSRQLREAEATPRRSPLLSRPRRSPPLCRLPSGRLQQRLPRQQRESARYLNAPKAWWCAQRYYMDALSKLVSSFPSASWYFLADADTVVFPHVLHPMLRLLDEVLVDTEDLYMGHGRDLSIGRFVMSGGGVLLRGRTARRLAGTGQWRRCFKENLNGTWCWRHLDWVLADCLREVGITARGHPGFQQFVTRCSDCCRPESVACHPVKDKAAQKQLVAKHRGIDTSRFLADWAMPCNDNEYRWDQSKKSICDSSG